MKKEDVFIFYLRITGIYKKRDEKAGVYSIGVSRKCLLIQVNAVKTPLRQKKRDVKAGVYSIGVSRKCLLIQVNAVKTPLRHNTAVPLFMKKEDVFIFCLRITGIYNKRNEKAGVYSIGVSRKSFLIQVYAVKTPLRQQGLQKHQIL